ncbi:hypothetical protein GCM10009677_00450 [Sphaerisporangium rubeum]
MAIEQIRSMESVDHVDTEKHPAWKHPVAASMETVAGQAPVFPGDLAGGEGNRCRPEKAWTRSGGGGPVCQEPE